MSEQKKLWGARLKPGINPGNLVAYYLVTLITMMVVVSTNVLQPYLLSTFMKIPLLEIGSATANIALVNEFVLLIFVGLWGVISDKSGRKFVWAIGCIIMGVGYGIMPIAEQVVALIGFRAIYTIGVAATTGMMATVIADYVVNEDRGKASAIMGIMNGLGAATGALLLGKMPQMYDKMEGVDGIQAGWYAYTTDIVICVVVALIVVFGLSNKKPDGAARATFAEKIKIGIAAAKEDAGVALSYAAAFVSRADLVIAGLYFPLWFSKFFQDKVEVTKTIVDGSPEHTALLARVAELDIDVGVLGTIAPQSAEHIALLEAACAKGIANGGMIIGIAGMAGLCFAPVIGIMCDKINRTTALAITLLLNFIGYGMIFFVGDPTEGLLIGAAVVVGFGQVGATIAAQVMIQQQAKPALRGSIIGFFGMCGALGIMLMCWVGGYVFDHINPQSPFVLLGFLNLIVFFVAIALKSKIKAPEGA